MIYPLLLLVSYILGYLCAKRGLFTKEKKGELILNCDLQLKEYKHKFTIGGLVEVKKGKHTIAKTKLKRTEVGKVG